MYQTVLTSKEKPGEKTREETQHAAAQHPGALNVVCMLQRSRAKVL
jgi:hypothetical protein